MVRKLSFIILTIACVFLVSCIKIDQSISSKGNLESDFVRNVQFDNFVSFKQLFGNDNFDGKIVSIDVVIDSHLWLYDPNQFYLCRMEKEGNKICSERTIVPLIAENRKYVRTLLPELFVNQIAINEQANYRIKAYGTFHKTSFPLVGRHGDIETYNNCEHLCIDNIGEGNSGNPLLKGSFTLQKLKVVEVIRNDQKR